MVLLLSPLTAVATTSVTASLNRPLGNTSTTEPSITGEGEKKPCISDISLTRSVQNGVDKVPLFGITELWSLTIVTVEPSIVPLHTPTFPLSIATAVLTKTTVYPSERSVVVPRIVSTNVAPTLLPSPTFRTGIRVPTPNTLRYSA